MAQTVLYTRTSIAAARAAQSEGFHDETWSFPIRGRDDDEVVVEGVWLTDKPLERFEGPAGQATLEITLDLSEEDLARYEHPEVFGHARLWVVPAALVNPTMRLRIAEVDPDVSWSTEWGQGSP